MALAADGTLDATFGVGGKVVQDFGQGTDILYDTAIQDDGKIVIVANSRLARFNGTGALDPTFGTGGLVSFNSIQAHFEAVTLQPDGRIVVAGRKLNDVAIARYHPNGAIDQSFGVGGLITIDLGATAEESVAVGVRSDGKIVVAAEAFHVAATQTDFAVVRGAVVQMAEGLAIQADGAIAIAVSGANTFTVVRYRSDGSLDTSFRGERRQLRLPRE